MEITERSSRAFWARPKFIIWSICLILIGVILAQNAEKTSVDVLFWTLATLPKWLLIIISMALGALLTMVGFFHARRNRNTFTPE